MCVITSMVATTTTAFVIGSLVEAAAVAATVSAATTAAMGGERRDIIRSGLIGAGFGLAGGAAGALGGMAAGAAFGASAGAASGAAGGSAAGAASAEGTGMLATMAANATQSATTVGAVSGGISGVTGAVTTTASGLQNIEDAKMEREYLNKKAALEDARAQQALDNAAVEKADQRKKMRMLQGQGKVVAASNGVMLEGQREESLASMWETDVAIEGAYDRAKIQHNADLEAWGYRANADLMRQRGNALVKQARKNFNTSIFTGLATTSVSAFGSAFAMGAMQGLGAASQGASAAKTSGAAASMIT